MRPWDIFFSAITLAIIITMVLPQAFGLQYFTQWGGMYTDGWCQAYVRMVSQENAETTATLRCPTKSPVWFAPMHREDTCIAWAQSWCGVEREEGAIVSVQAYFRNAYIAQEQNVCDLPRHSPPWFEQ